MAATTGHPDTDQPASRGASSTDSLTLSNEAMALLTELRQRDREVRQHEQAHISAGGQHVVGGAQYQYERGPDGQIYAVSGSVNLDVSPVPGDPEATEEKAKTIRRAAMAPAEPSAQDQNVAAKAAAMEAQARMEEILKERTEREPHQAQTPAPQNLAGSGHSIHDPILKTETAPDNPAGQNQTGTASRLRGLAAYTAFGRSAASDFSQFI